jgi:hypothetical protein
VPPRRDGTGLAHQSPKTSHYLQGNAMSERVKQLIEQAPLLGIPWSQSLCTRSGLRVCLLDEGTGKADYPVMALIDLGGESATEIFTGEGHYMLDGEHGYDLVSI